MKLVIILSCLAIFLLSIDAQTTTTDSEDLTTPLTTSGTTRTTRTTRRTRITRSMRRTRRRSTTTENPACFGSVANPNCSDLLDEGTTNGTDCASQEISNMWHYSHELRACSQMTFKGCGGNSNRFCSKKSCQKECDP